MDQDGENHRFLTDGRTLVLTPRFSPSAQEITYLSYVDSKPRVYLFNIDTGRQEAARRFPRHDLRAALLAGWQQGRHEPAATGGNDRHLHDGPAQPPACAQLTNSAAIDTSPSYSPDGQRIVFNSDRGGSQQLYVMDADGGGNPADHASARAAMQRRYGRRAAT